MATLHALIPSPRPSSWSSPTARVYAVPERSRGDARTGCRAVTDDQTEARKHIRGQPTNQRARGRMGMYEQARATESETGDPNSTIVPQTSAPWAED